MLISKSQLPGPMLTKYAGEFPVRFFASSKLSAKKPSIDSTPASWNIGARNLFDQ
jgi:hypothetical protein